MTKVSLVNNFGLSMAEVNDLTLWQVGLLIEALNESRGETKKTSAAQRAGPGSIPVMS